MGPLPRLATASVVDDLNTGKVGLLLGPISLSILKMAQPRGCFERDAAASTHAYI